MSLFQGLSAFPITPADDDGVVDEAAFRKVLNHIAPDNVASLGVLGSTGTYPYLKREQRRRAIEVAVDVVSGSIPIMVGIGALRTDEAVRLARDAKDAGADALLLAPVSYIPLSQEDVFQHFATVASATDLPLCIYNNPVATHFNFSDDLLIRLANIPTIGGVKMPSPEKSVVHIDVPDQLSRLLPHMPTEFKIGYSGDPRAANAVAHGGAAWYSGMASVLPTPISKLYRAAQAGELEEVERMNAVLASLWSLCGSVGTLRVIYAVANETGLFDGHPPLPILPATADERQSVSRALSELSAT